MNTPKPGVEKPARLVEFKYFTNASGPGGACPHAAEPNMETITQALAYRQALARHPNYCSGNKWGRFNGRARVLTRRIFGG